jgi:hypothetical protein
MTAKYCSDTDTLCIELREVRDATTNGRVDGGACLAFDCDGIDCRILILHACGPEARDPEPKATPPKTTPPKAMPLERPKTTVVC